MKNTQYIIIIVLLGIIVGALVWSNNDTDSGMDDDQTASSTESVAYSGDITELDYSAIAADGPYRIVLETPAGESRTVLVPSMGINLCAAQESITNLDLLAVGDMIEAHGSVGSEADSIIVCESEDHYLRLGSTGEWQTYESAEHSFSLQYPEGWEVATDTTPTNEPLVSIYPPESITTEPPFTHHSAETHVSVYPQGIPTEGVSGQQATSTVAFSVALNEARDYLLSDGTRFATYANLGAIGSGWNSSGFLFAHTAVENLETECRRDGKEVPMEQCDVLMEDTLVRHGEIDESVRRQQVQILESFQIERQ